MREPITASSSTSAHPVPPPYMSALRRLVCQSFFLIRQGFVLICQRFFVTNQPFFLTCEPFFLICQPFVLYVSPPSLCASPSLYVALRVSLPPYMSPRLTHVSTAREINPSTTHSSNKQCGNRVLLQSISQRKMAADLRPSPRLRRLRWSRGGRNDIHARFCPPPQKKTKSCQTQAESSECEQTTFVVQAESAECVHQEPRE